MKFVEMVVKSKAGLIFLVKGKEKYQGKSAWYYVLANKLKLPIMQEKIAYGLNISDYGTVLYSGWGENPPDDIRQKIQQEYS